jgi:hypothetical protein
LEGETTTIIRLPQSPKRTQGVMQVQILQLLNMNFCCDMDEASKAAFKLNRNQIYLNDVERNCNTQITFLYQA